MNSKPFRIGFIFENRRQIATVVKMPTINNLKILFHINNLVPMIHGFPETLLVAYDPLNKFFKAENFDDLSLLRSIYAAINDYFHLHRKAIV
jgi:hypothetical protein